MLLSIVFRYFPTFLYAFLSSPTFPSISQNIQHGLIGFGHLVLDFFIVMSPFEGWLPSVRLSSRTITIQWSCTCTCPNGFRYALRPNFKILLLQNLPLFLPYFLWLQNIPIKIKIDAIARTRVWYHIK